MNCLSSLQIFDSSPWVTPCFGMVSPCIHNFSHVVGCKDQCVRGLGPNIVSGMKPRNVDGSLFVCDGKQMLCPEPQIIWVVSLVSRLFSTVEWNSRLFSTAGTARWFGSARAACSRRRQEALHGTVNKGCGKHANVWTQKGCGNEDWFQIATCTNRFMHIYRNLNLNLGT